MLILGSPPFIIYGPIKFQKPVEISEKEYHLLKMFGYIENTITESFWELNKWNIRLIIVALCILFISSAIHVTEDTNQALHALGIIILIYMIPRFIIESIKYYKFKEEVATFNKKVKFITSQIWLTA